MYFLCFIKCQTQLFIYDYYYCIVRFISFNEIAKRGELCPIFAQVKDQGQRIKPTLTLVKCT